MNRIGVGKRYPVECFCMLAVLLVAVIQLLVSPAYADSGDLLSSQGEDFGLEEIVDEGSPVSPDSSAGSPSGDLGSGGEGEAPAGGQGEPPVGGDGEAAGSPSDPPDVPTADEEGGTAPPADPPSPPRDGWVEVDGLRYYYEGGEPLEGPLFL
ncbi:hypothetical protein, partial [Gordonibacter sp. An230]|uniref:hypothetical protein n=1 Tax=Gordonibacter sp. An230 TaxID=1965592 RepID=UPI001950C441